MDTAAEQISASAAPHLRVVLPDEQRTPPPDATAEQAAKPAEAPTGIRRSGSAKQPPTFPRVRLPSRKAMLFASIATLVVLGGGGLAYQNYTLRHPAQIDELGLGNAQGRASRPAPRRDTASQDGGTAMRGTADSGTAGDFDDASAPPAPADTAAALASILVGTPSQPRPAPPAPTPAPQPATTPPAPTITPPPTIHQAPADVPAPAPGSATPAQAPAPAPATPTSAPSVAAAQPAQAAPVTTGPSGTPSTPQTDTLSKAVPKDVVMRTLGLVETLSNKVSDLSDQNEQIRKQVAALSQTVASLADLDQRLQLNAASAAVARAVSGVAAPETSPAPTASDSSPRTQQRSRHALHGRAAYRRNEEAQAIDTTADAGMADAGTTDKPETAKPTLAHYSLQAASPDFAILSSPNGATEVHVGDTLPGYGQVTSIAMRGAAWVVLTEHGAIR